MVSNATEEIHIELWIKQKKQQLKIGFKKLLMKPSQRVEARLRHGHLNFKKLSWIVQVDNIAMVRYAEILVFQCY